jgi:enoyl-CoA hydratase/carnithine racemase
VILQIEDDKRVRTLTLNRPEALNAFNEALYDATAEALLAAAGDPDVAVVLLTGTGRGLSAGTDLAECRHASPTRTSTNDANPLARRGRLQIERGGDDRAQRAPASPAVAAGPACGGNLFRCARTARDGVGHRVIGGPHAQAHVHQRIPWTRA